MKLIRKTKENTFRFDFLFLNYLNMLTFRTCIMFLYDLNLFTKQKKTCR